MRVGAAASSGTTTIAPTRGCCSTPTSRSLAHDSATTIPLGTSSRINRQSGIGGSDGGYGPWFGQFQLRYFGPRPLSEDDSVRSKATTLAYLRVGCKITPNVRLAIDVSNPFDRKASGIDDFYASRLQGEPLAGVEDVHFHPVEPRRIRASLIANF